jgi:hypothetical protein
LDRHLVEFTRASVIRVYFVFSSAVTTVHSVLVIRIGVFDLLLDIFLKFGLVERAHFSVHARGVHVVSVLVKGSLRTFYQLVPGVLPHGERLLAQDTVLVVDRCLVSLPTKARHCV